jgi:hypothetical protein
MNFDRFRSMTRTARISKLSHAIRDYRGIYNRETGKWITPPQPAAKARVERWLISLRLDVPKTLETIDGFKTGDEFRAWLRKLGIQKTSE